MSWTQDPDDQRDFDIDDAAMFLEGHPDAPDYLTRGAQYQLDRLLDKKKKKDG